MRTLIIMMALAGLVLCVPAAVADDHVDQVERKACNITGPMCLDLPGDPRDEWPFAGVPDPFEPCTCPPIT